MRKFKTCRPRALPFRLLALAASGLLLTAAFVPGANATLLVYFNFEDGSIDPQLIDFASDETAAFGGNNPGGGIQHSTLDLTGYTAGQFDSISSVIPIGTTNQSAGDVDHPPSPPGTPGIAVNFFNSQNNNDSFIQFAVNATFFTDMSLSLAANTNGNGFTTQMWQTNTGVGGMFVTFATFNGLTGLQTLGPTLLPTAANGKTDLVIRIVFSGGQSNGQDDQTIIDNIQLNGTVIPEPATVVGGLFGLCGLCWHQRRRLIRFVRLRRA